MWDWYEPYLDDDEVCQTTYTHDINTQHHTDRTKHIRNSTKLMSYATLQAYTIHSVIECA